MGLGIQWPGCFRCLHVGVDPHVTQVTPEARPEESACRLRQGLATSLQRLDVGFCFGSELGQPTRNPLGLEHFFLVVELTLNGRDDSRSQRLSLDRRLLLPVFWPLFGGACHAFSMNTHR